MSRFHNARPAIPADDETFFELVMQESAWRAGISVSEAHAEARCWMIALGDSIGVNLRHASESELRAFVIRVGERGAQALASVTHLPLSDYLASPESDCLTYAAGLQAVLELFGGKRVVVS
jgi:hypothetical protein